MTATLSLRIKLLGGQLKADIGIVLCGAHQAGNVNRLARKKKGERSGGKKRDQEYDYLENEARKLPWLPAQPTSAALLVCSPALSR